jgi:hypothetical protein
MIIVSTIAASYASYDVYDAYEVKSAYTKTNNEDGNNVKEQGNNDIQRPDSSSYTSYTSYSRYNPADVSSSNIITDVSNSIYRLGHSDSWACHNCKQIGDIHYMKQHLCSGKRP